MEKSSILLEQLQHDQNPEQVIQHVEHSHSTVETRLLQILEKTDKHSISLDKLMSELLASSFSQLQIQKAIVTLLEQDLVDTVYTPSEGLGLILSSRKQL